MSVRYGVSKGLDTAYWAFLGVGTTFDIFQNIIFLLLNTAYRIFWIRRIDLIPFDVFGKCRHGYAVSVLMDTAYWSSNQYFFKLSSFKLQNVRTTKTPMDRENPWGKDGPGKDVDLHLYRSMIGYLMYLTASRPDIMFAVYVCARHQVTPKECHLHAVKRIFRYLKGQPLLGLWYPKESPFDLVAYSDSDYDGDNQDRKSTTRGYNNVADFLTKPFDVGRFQYLVDEHVMKRSL
ncbi:hypothetical protein Tco_0413480 [Tanacetum coccineum]